MKVFLIAALLTLSGYYLYEYLTEAKQVQIVESELVPFTPSRVDGRKYESLVRIEHMFKGKGMCSGAVISDDYILTAAHCVVDSDYHMIKNEFDVSDMEHTNTGVKAKAVAVDVLRDIALVKGDFHDFNILPVETIGTPPNGIPLVSCGYPANGQPTCVHEELAGNIGFQYIMQGTLIFQGDSGGPVFATTPMGPVIVGVNSAALYSTGMLVGPIVAMEYLWKLPKK